MVIAMKSRKFDTRLLAAALSVLVAGGVIAAHAHSPLGSQDSNGEVDAIGAWLNAMSAQGAAEQARHVIQGTRQTEGSYRVVPLADLDAPEAVKQLLRDRFERARSGVERVGIGEIPSQSTLAASIPRTVRSDGVLRQRLPAPPTDLQRTVLGAAELLGMEPSGVLEGMKSSGLTRFYRLPDAGIIEFNEENFRASLGRIDVIAEANNTEVAGVPAQLRMVQDPTGRSRVTLLWMKGEKAYSLAAIGDEHHDVRRMAQVLQGIASAVVD